MTPEHFHHFPQLIARAEPWSGRISFVLRESDGQKWSIATKFEMRQVSQGDVIDPSFSLEKEDAQKLMDSLWDCGLRPSEGSGSAGALAATQRHLDDMRKLVFEVKP